MTENTHFFQINDWKIKNFVLLVVSFNFALLGSFGISLLQINEFEMPLFRQIVTTVYLISIPGSIILRILKIHNINPIEALVFTVGLSISFLMFFGCIFNFISPLVGISDPLSEINLVGFFSIVIFLLTFLAFKRDQYFIKSNPWNYSNSSNNSILICLLILILSVLGAQLINFLNYNVITLTLFVIIASIPILVVYDKVNEKFYPLLIFFIALSLLYHRSLISLYIAGWDINIEYYYSNLVINNSLWDITLPSNVNSMLSTAMFAPIFSKLSGIPLDWVFKIIYPFLYAFLPLCLYRIYQIQTNNKTAFLSTFLFMSTFIFYQVMPDLPRQMLAELFACSTLLLIVTVNFNPVKKTILLIIFLMSIVVSHYGFSYIFTFLIIVSWGILNLNFLKKQTVSLITLNITLLYVVFTLFWFLYTAKSNIFNIGVNIIHHIAYNLFVDFLTSNSSQVVNIIASHRFLMHDITKYLHIFVQLFIFLGIFSLFTKTHKFNLNKDYVAYSLSSFMLLIAAVLLPFFASQLSFNRIYQITLLVLAPFFVLGIIKVIDMINIPHTEKVGYKFISFFLFFFLLFNSGVIYEFAKEPSYMSLNGEIDYPRFNTQEVNSAIWLNENYNDKINVYVDSYRSLILSKLGITHSSVEKSSILAPDDKAYFFLGRENVKNDKMIVTNWTIPTSPVTESKLIHESTLYRTLEDSDLLYNSGDAKVYYL